MPLVRFCIAGNWTSVPYKPLKSSAVNVHLSSCVCVCYVWEALYKVGDNSMYLWPIIIVVFNCGRFAWLLSYFAPFPTELKTQEAVCGSK